MLPYRRVVLLPLVALVAACAGQDQTAVDPLGRDLVLATQVQTDAVERELSAVSGAAAACRAEPTAVQPTAAQLTRAGQLMRQAQELELMGDMRRAHQLLVQAAQADGTNPALAYHLARSSDALQEKSAAIDAYCRFLVLSPGTVQAAEVRTRLTTLLGAELPAVDAQATQAESPRTPAKTSVRTASTARGTIARPARSTRLASARRAATPVRSSGGGAMTGSANGAVDGSMGTAPNERVPQTPQTPQTSQAGDAPVTAPAPVSTARAGNNTARGAIIGAAAGAVVGTVVGRDVKSGVIGAAAGGLLGAAVGHSTSGSRALRGRYATPTWSPR
jgi:hypothetical protein